MHALGPARRTNEKVRIGFGPKEMGGGGAPNNEQA
jgi:hypothetical protein